MATDISFVEYVCEQVGQSHALSFRKMFGEFAFYLDGKLVALACDNQLFIKPTTAGREMLGCVDESPPYPGAKPQFLIGHQLDDRDLMGRLFIATAHALPVPRPRARKTKTSKTRG